MEKKEIKPIMKQLFVVLIILIMLANVIAFLEMDYSTDTLSASNTNFSNLGNGTPIRILSNLSFGEDAFLGNGSTIPIAGNLTFDGSEFFINLDGGNITSTGDICIGTC